MVLRVKGSRRDFTVVSVAAIDIISVRVFVIVTATFVQIKHRGAPGQTATPRTKADNLGTRLYPPNHTGFGILLVLKILEPVARLRYSLNSVVELQLLDIEALIVVTNVC